MPAYYSNSVEQFIKTNTDEIVGVLASEYAKDGFVNLINKQLKTWKSQIEILKASLTSLEIYNSIKNEWTIIFEYSIPMIGQRIDTLLLTNNNILVIEFKVGSEVYLSQDKLQLYNYVMDLRDFHFESRNRTLVPILVSTDSNQNAAIENFEGIDIILCGKSSLKEIFVRSFSNSSQIEFKHIDWLNSNYLPTPDIIRSAQLLFAGQDVTAILNSIAEANILNNTTSNVIDIYNSSKVNKKKSICFVTGVPGSGKTLVGLNVIHSKDISKDGEFNGSFITGNVPLVLLLREALARDSINRNPNQRITNARHIVSTYLHKVHLFIKSHLNDIPFDNLIVFDEAQRAWDQKMAQKHELVHSEPFTILDTMSRKEWCLIVALVGEGQEIHEGEAGIQEWLNVLHDDFENWEVYMSNELRGTINVEGIQNLVINNNLNLTVSVRSIRSNYLSEWVESVLALNSHRAREIKSLHLKRYPIFITRDFNRAKKFVKFEKNDLERKGRHGIIASSGGRRLRPYGITVQESHKIEEWFLNEPTDVRSSNFFELVMTEFSIQGLELDWTCLCWDADLRLKNNAWNYFLNKYRVLLTRAREGIVIFIPEGSDEDKTRQKTFYDETFDFLINCGVELLR